MESAELYKNAGVNNVQVNLYPEARHEILLELNREEVYNDVIQWIKDVLNS